MVKTMEENDQAVENASIRVFLRSERGSALLMECQTNQNGESERIALQAPDNAHSIDIHSLIRPYGQYDFHIEKEGFDTEIRNAIQIFAGVDSTLPVVMHKNNGHTNSNTFDIGEHQLHEGGECRTC